MEAGSPRYPLLMPAPDLPALPSNPPVVARMQALVRQWEAAGDAEQAALAQAVEAEALRLGHIFAGPLHA
jgi:hypothetical protein